MTVINEIIGTVVQIIAFALIPFLFFLIKRKTTNGFFDYIGLKRSTEKANSLALFASLLFAAPALILTFFSEDFRQIMLDPGSITGKFRQMGFGFQPVVILLTIAIFKTALAEEIFFRGFVAKRLLSATGFVKANLIQAAIFGIVHTALFAIITKNPLFLTVIFIIPAAGAYVSVCLNEKVGNGSIVPGWISHGLANVVSYAIVGFLV